MANLILSSVPAQRKGACISTSYDLTGTVPDPLPRETVAIRTAADAQAAFDAYRARAEAGGIGAQVTGRLADGERAPRGFRSLTLRDYVCLDGPAMVPQPVQQQQAQAGAPLNLDGIDADRLERDAAACRRTAARFRDKAETSGAIEAGRLRHSAKLLDADAVQAEHDAQQLRSSIALADDDGCPKSDPDCMGGNGDCHDACEAPQAQHTAGPWEVTRNMGGELAPFQKATGAHLLSSEGPLPFEEREANAAVIGAAPDMLAALKEAAAWIRCELAGRLQVEALANAEAAIRRAEGAAVMVPQLVQQQEGKATAPAISDDAFRAAAYAAHGREGEIECDDTAIVSRGDEPGAFVAMWVWVSNEAAQAHMPAPAMVPQQAQQQQGRDMRAASPGPAPEILDVSELLERIQAATGPAVVWTAPDAETPRVPLEPMQPAPVILLAGLAGLLAAASAFIIALSA